MPRLSLDPKKGILRYVMTNTMAVITPMNTIRKVLLSCELLFMCGSLYPDGSEMIRKVLEESLVIV